MFSRYKNQMQAFRLEGDRYQLVTLSAGRLLISSIQLSLGLWQGRYQGIERLWLRWMTLAGDLVLTPEERAEKLTTKLQELGISPEL